MHVYRTRIRSFCSQVLNEFMPLVDVRVEQCRTATIVFCLNVGTMFEQNICSLDSSLSPRPNQTGEVILIPCFRRKAALQTTLNMFHVAGTASSDKSPY